jgi:hypothetical protein
MALHAQSHAPICNARGGSTDNKANYLLGSFVNSNPRAGHITSRFLKFETNIFMECDRNRIGSRFVGNGKVDWPRVRVVIMKNTSVQLCVQ